MPKITPSRIGNYLGAIQKHIEGALLATFTIMLVAEVLQGILARYVQFEVVFAAELGKYTFIWLCAIGISAAARDNQHVRLTLIVDRLPVSRRLSWVVSQVLFLLFTLLLFYLGLQLTIMHFELDKSAMGFQFPMYIFTAAIPFGMGLTSIRLVANIIGTFRSPDQQPWDAQEGGLAGITLKSKGRIKSGT